MSEFTVAGGLDFHQSRSLLVMLENEVLAGTERVDARKILDGLKSGAYVSLDGEEQRRVD